MTDRPPVIVLDVIEPGFVPEYCVVGKTPCIHCDEWCWLGDATYPVVESGQALALCAPCARELIPPDQHEPIGHVSDTRHEDGAHG